MIIPKANRECADSSPHLIVNVPRQTSFHVGVGKYSASVRSITPKFRQGGSGSTPFVRYLLNVNVPGANLDYLAKIDFALDMNEGSDLWNVLCRLKGRKVLQDCSEKQFDLGSLVGVPCDVEIGHITDHADEYEFPLVVVMDIQPPGTLVTVAEGGAKS